MFELRSNSVYFFLNIPLKKVHFDLFISALVPRDAFLEKNEEFTFSYA